MDDLLYRAMDLVEMFGAPLAIAAWLTVSVGAVAMGFVLRRDPPDARAWRTAALVAFVSLLAHSADIAVTLMVSPDLELEGNPIWKIAVRTFGLPVAIGYGLTGQFLVVVLSFQLFAWYLVVRPRLFPREASGFLDFQKKFGGDEPRIAGISWRSVACFFAFLFAGFGPYFFYIALHNAVGGWVDDPRVLDALPSPVLMIVVYLLSLGSVYGIANWRAFLRRA
jgi:hypothetical protein